MAVACGNRMARRRLGGPGPSVADMAKLLAHPLARSQVIESDYDGVFRYTICIAEPNGTLVFRKCDLTGTVFSPACPANGVMNI